MKTCPHLEAVEGGSEATFFCTECKHAITGVHPNYANAMTKRIA